MGKKRNKTALDQVCETIQTAQLRLAISSSLPQPRMHQTASLGELIEAREALDMEIEVLGTALALARAKRKGPKRANHKDK